MKTIFGYLVDYLKDHFQFKLYLLTTLLVGILLWINFTLDLEDSYIDTIPNEYFRWFMFVVLQGVPYYLVCLFAVICNKKQTWIRSKEFWLVSLFGLVILAFDRSNLLLNILAEHNTNIYSYAFYRRILGNLIGLITIFIPMFFFYQFFLKKNLSHFYGIRVSGVHLKPYWVMLMIMVPLIIMASFQPDFLDVYPTYQASGASLMIKHMGSTNATLLTTYEVSYAFAFFIVELMFRGFFIFALVKYMGKEVVLPMAVTYCVLHFGKPLGEAISSYFGGYLLGLIALKTENIYGGIMVHIGIALLMELFAFLQY